MRVGSLLSQDTLFDFDTLRLAGDTFYESEDQDAGSAPFFRAPPAPISVVVSSETRARQGLVSTAAAGIETAASVNRSVASYLADVRSLLKEMAAYADTAASDGGNVDFSSLNDAFQEKLGLLDAFSQGATFNGAPILQGGSIEALATADGAQLSISLGDARPASLGLSGINLTSRANAAAAADAVAAALESVDSQLAWASDQDAMLQARLDGNNASLHSTADGLAWELEQSRARSQAHEAMGRATASLLLAAVRKGSDTLRGAIQSLDDQAKSLSDALAEERARQGAAAAEKRERKPDAKLEKQKAAQKAQDDSRKAQDHIAAAQKAQDDSRKAQDHIAAAQKAQDDIAAAPREPWIPPAPRQKQASTVPTL